MSATLSLTVTDAEATRCQAAARGLGYTDARAMVIALAAQAVTGWERSELAATYSTPPIAPT